MDGFQKKKKVKYYFRHLLEVIEQKVEQIKLVTEVKISHYTINDLMLNEDRPLPLVSYIQVIFT